ncbi:unnamed protein product [Hymenolepis diminuta]|uniref:Uncharacterized protein n=1 Tax=Hymenolepis diminuta TaxID=6216 RepID=A0A0R3S7J7_HYMDI|nr:unnamed protein product [Hymenolepis diminuta]
MLPPHCYYTPNFESKKYGNRGEGLFSSKGLESTSSASALRGSDQTHLLNDANHMETSLVFISGSPNSANNLFATFLFHTTLTLLIGTLNLLSC